MNALEGFLELVRTYPGAFAYLAAVLTLCALGFSAAIIGLRVWLDNRTDAGFLRDHTSRRAEWRGNQDRDTLRRLHGERA